MKKNEKLERSVETKQRIKRIEKLERSAEMKRRIKRNEIRSNTNNIATYSFVTIDVGVGFDFEICSTMQRTENFTKYYFLTPPCAFAEGGSRIFRRGAKKIVEGG